MTLSYTHTLFHKINVWRTHLVCLLCSYVLLSTILIIRPAYADSYTPIGNESDLDTFAKIENLSAKSPENQLRIPLSSALQEDLPIELSVTPPKNTNFVQIKLELRDEAGTLVSQSTNNWNNRKIEKISLLTSMKTDASHELLQGIYTLKIKTTLKHAGQLQNYLQEAKIYRFDAKKPPLPTSFIARLSVVALHSNEYGFDNQLYRQNKGKFEQLHTLLKELYTHPRERITLSIPLASLEDIYRLAHTAEFEDRDLMAEILSLLQDLSKSDRIQLVYSGYNDPDLNNFTTPALLDEVKEHYQLPPQDLSEKLGITLHQGVVARNLSLPRALIPQFVAAQVPWIACLPSGLDTLAQNAYSSELYYLHEAPQIKVLKAYDKFLSSLQKDASSELYERFLAIHKLPKQEHSARMFIGIYPFSQHEQELTTFIKTLRFAAAQNWISLISAEELSQQNSEKSLNGIDVIKDRIPPLADSLEHAGSYVQALRAAQLKHSETYAQAHSKLRLAEAGGWEDMKGGIQRAQHYAQEAQKLANSVFSQVSILSQEAHLSGKSGEIPLILKQESSQDLSLTIVAEGSPGLLITDDKFIRGATAGTAAGENYLSIPVKLVDVSLSDHTLTVKAYAGRQLIAQSEIIVAASRMDIILTLVAGLIFFIVLLFILRYRLRHAGLARAFDNTGASTRKLDRVIEQIKHEVHREALSSRDDNPEGPVHEAGLSPRFAKRHGNHVVYAGDKLINPAQEHANPDKNHSQEQENTLPIKDTHESCNTTNAE